MANIRRGRRLDGAAMERIADRFRRIMRDRKRCDIEFADIKILTGIKKPLILERDAALTIDS